MSVFNAGTKQKSENHEIILKQSPVYPNYRHIAYGKTVSSAQNYARDAGLISS